MNHENGMTLSPSGSKRRGTKKRGSIHVIKGPMFSGKTTELFRRICRHRVADEPCLVIKHSHDNRYTKEPLLASTHDRFMMRADVTCTELVQVPEEDLERVTVVAIDEGQFFSDLYERFDDWATRLHLTVIVAALDTTFERLPFPEVSRLVSTAEYVDKLLAVCFVCKKNAAFTRRLGHETKLEVIGGADMYAAVCRRCYSLSSLSCPSSTIESTILSPTPTTTTTVTFPLTPTTCILSSLSETISSSSSYSTSSSFSESRSHSSSPTPTPSPSLCVPLTVDSSFIPLLHV